MTSNDPPVFSGSPEDGQNPRYFCGTAYAAKVLGMSVATVQQLVERNLLDAWKTKGGHRRISLDSLNRYMKSREGPKAANDSLVDAKSSSGRMKVLIVDDDEGQRDLYATFLEEWSEQIEVTLLGSAMDAIMDISALSPDLLITDVDMPNVDGLEMLRMFGNADALSHMHVLVITGLSADAVHKRGGLSPGAILQRKPVDFAWLQGYLSALLQTKALKGL